MIIPETPTFDSIKPVLETLPRPYHAMLCPNKSGRVYTNECLEKAAAEFSQRVKSRTMLVHTEDRVPDMVSLQSVIGVVKEAHFDGEHINIQVAYKDESWKLLEGLDHLNFYAHGDCAGSGSEVVEMRITSVLASLSADA